MSFLRQTSRGVPGESTGRGSGLARLVGTIPLAALVLAALLLAPRCAAPPGTQSRLGMVRAPMPNFPSSLSLIGKTDTSSEVLARLVTDSLFQYDTALELKPRLAASWTISPDGRTLVFRLRDGVRWHDGAPVTASDVVFTVEKVRDPSTEARSYLPSFQALVSVKALDALTVEARYSEPYADVLDAWTLPIIPRHAAEKDTNLLTGAFSRHPIGCGPFRFVRAEPGREIVLEANPDYWDGRPLLDRLAFEILPDERTSYQALLRGDLDMLVVTPDFWKEAQEAVAGSRFRRAVFFPLSAWYIGWNEDGSNPFFVDARVRRAMVLALDRKTFADRVASGMARPAVGTFHPDSPWADATIEPWPYDPPGAARLLEEAGWRTVAGSRTRSRAGVPFSFTLTIPAGTQEMTDRMAAWIQHSLAAVGVRMEIEKLEWKTFLERRRAHQFQAAMASLRFTPIPDQYELYHSTSRQNGLNYVGLADPEVDRVLDEGRRTFDPARRREIYSRLQRRLHDLEPLSCLFHFASPLLYDSRLEGIKPSPLGLWQTTPGPRQWKWGGSGAASR